MMKSEQTKRAAVEMVRTGTPVSQVAKTYGVSAAGVRIWVKKAAATTVGRTIAKPEAIATKPTLARVRDAIATLTEAGLI
jgi:transposase-like protein